MPIQYLINEYDKFNMAEVIKRTPEQISTALSLKVPRIDSSTINRVIIAGMGGSSLAADVINDAFAESLSFPIHITRSYSLPAHCKDTTLVIISSFSGNTEEMLTCLQEAADNSCHIVVLTSGGYLLEAALEKNIPVIKIPVHNEPEELQPRSTMGYTVTLLSRFLYENGLMKSPVKELESLPLFLKNIDVRTEAEQLAASLRNRIPIILTDNRHIDSIARIFKTKLNENSKVPAFFNALPEFNHNEMLGFLCNVADFSILYLHDTDSNPKIEQRYRIVERLYSEKGINNTDFYSWTIPGETSIEKIFAAMLLADWCSYTLAIINQQDPTPVEMIELFKYRIATD